MNWLQTGLAGAVRQRSQGVNRIELAAKVDFPQSLPTPSSSRPAGRAAHDAGGLHQRGASGVRLVLTLVPFAKPGRSIRAYTAPCHTSDMEA